MIVIVGAGAAGLMAARELSAKGEQVIVLEAADRTGGRIHTLYNSSFQRPVEESVEFIHGNLPLTIQLLKEAGIEYTAVGGKMIRIANGQWKTQDDFTIGWDKLVKYLKQLEGDMTVSDFLQKRFNGNEYADLRKSVLRFAEGFDLADPDRASILSLANEWIHEEDEQYRIPKGFSQLIRYLEGQCKSVGVIIHTSSLVKKIAWKKNEVKIHTSEGNVFTASKVIVTVPLGVLQADASQRAAISFEPSINQYQSAVRQIGYGSVIKILLEFKTPFWNNYNNDIGFIFSEEIIPTWWTQSPDNYPLLTGWLGGPQVIAVNNADSNTILHLSLKSLSAVFKTSIDALHNALAFSHIAKWHSNPFTLGAYSYNTLQSAKAKELLNTPVDGTLFFAGEALYVGSSLGTVEAALVSGKAVAHEILHQL